MSWCASCERKMTVRNPSARSKSFMRHPIKSCLNFSSFLSSDVSDYCFRFFFGPILVRRSQYVFSSRKKSKNLNFEKARFRLEERKFKTRLRDFVFGSQRENSEFKTRLPVKSKLLLLLYENLWSYNIIFIIFYWYWMVTFDQNGIKSN